MRGSTPCSSRVTTIFGDGSTKRKAALSAHGSAADGDIDLLDFAALMTLRQGGSVMLAPREALPPPGLSAAILRY